MRGGNAPPRGETANERKGWGSLRDRDPPRRPLRPHRPAGRPEPGGVDCARPSLEDLGECCPRAAGGWPAATAGGPPLCPEEALDRGTPARSPTLKDRSLVRSFDCIESETATPTPGCQGRPGPPRPRRGTKINPIPRKKPHRRGAPSPRCRHLHCSSPAREPPGRT